jgi:hypothetical protein
MRSSSTWKRVSAGVEVERHGQKKNKQQHEHADPPPKLKRKRYEREMRRLHGELVAMQE